MRRLRKYATILMVFAGLYFVWWFLDSRQEVPGPKSGTAHTVAELREQIPLHELLDDLPEIGPFHWEGPYTPYDPENEVSDDYKIRGKAEDPMLLLKWIHQEYAKESLNSQEVKLIGGFLTTGFGIDVYSDGSYEIGQYRYLGSGYSDISREK